MTPLVRWGIDPGRGREGWCLRGLVIAAGMRGLGRIKQGLALGRDPVVVAGEDRLGGQPAEIGMVVDRIGPDHRFGQPGLGFLQRGKGAWPAWPALGGAEPALDVRLSFGVCGRLCDAWLGALAIRVWSRVLVITAPPSAWITVGGP